MEKYSKEIEEYMKTHYSVLNEKDRRHYAAVEALKLSHGGTEYISNLLGLSSKTVRKGISELKKNSSSQSKA